MAAVYCERPERPGFLAVGEPGGGVIPVFSSLEELAVYVARRNGERQAGYDWFSTTGRNLLDLLPPGYDIVLDAASDHALRLRRRSLWRRPGVEITSRLDHEGAP